MDNRNLGSIFLSFFFFFFFFRLGRYCTENDAVLLEDTMMYIGGKRKTEDKKGIEVLVAETREPLEYKLPRKFPSPSICLRRSCQETRLYRNLKEKKEEI